MQERSQTPRQLILFLIIITSFINPFLGAAINIALPAISKEFSMGAVGMSWVAMAFLLSSAVFLVPLGKLADIKGRKLIFLIGNILITATSVFCALSQSGGMLITLRALQGIGSAMVFGTGVAIITSVYPPKERGKAIGITVTSVYIGLSLAPFLGGILTQYLGWRSIFLVTVPFGLLVIWITLKYIKEEWADAKGEKFDLPGSVIYLLSMSAFMFGFSRLPETPAIILAVTGLLVLILAIVGFGFGMFSSPNTNAIMGSVEKKYLGIASATVGTMRLTGQMMSMGIATLILQSFIGNRPISAQYSTEFMTSMRISFIVFVILCTLGVFASLARGKHNRLIKKTMKEV